MTSSVERVAAACARRRLSGAIVLFLAGHKPLAFIMGQMLYAVAPLLSLLNVQSVTDWAALFSEPGGLRHLQQVLTNTSTPTRRTRPMAPATRENHVLE